MTWTVRVGPHATTLSRPGTEVVTFDLEGRPVSWWEGDRTYKRSLASEVREIRRANRREYRTLPEEEALDRFRAILRTTREARDSIGPGEPRDRLDRVLRWSAGALRDERDRFRAAYSPIPILPPDQYTAVVLQATFGCTWNRCTFCSFYQDRPFRLRTEEEFRRHVEKVGDLLGEGAKLRRWTFLADGNALALSAERLDSLLRIAGERFPEKPLAGFLDVLAGSRKPEEEWRRRREAGLRRVHVGVESGHDPLLEWMDKPGRAADAVAMVRDLKAADLEVGLIFLVGAGGDRFARRHVEDTLRLVGGLPLDARDLVYLSPFVEHPGSAYASRGARDGIVPLDAEESGEQYAFLRDGIRALHPSLRVARYDLREFFY